MLSLSSFTDLKNQEHETSVHNENYSVLNGPFWFVKQCEMLASKYSMQNAVVNLADEGVSFICGYGAGNYVDRYFYATSNIVTNGPYRLTMQTDGNLVLYDINRALWSTGRSGSQSGAYAFIKITYPAGNMLLRNPNGTYYWDAGIWASGSLGVLEPIWFLQADANFVLYSGYTVDVATGDITIDGFPVASTGTAGAQRNTSHSFD